MVDEMIKIDRRVKKTKAALKEALITLMKEKDFREISITEIVQLADLNRGTFYKHYHFREDLLEEIINDVTDDLIASYREPYLNTASFDPRILTANAIKIFDHVAKHADFYTLVVNSNVLNSFQNKLCETLINISLQDLLNERADLKVDLRLLASYHIYAIYGMIIEWIKGGYAYSSEYMAEQLLTIIQIKK